MPDMILNKGEIAFLGALSYSQLASSAIKFCADGVRLFHKARYPHLNVAWNAYMQFVRQNRKLTSDREALAAFVTEAVEDDQDLPDELVERVQDIMRRFIAGASDPGQVPTRDDATAMLSYLVDEDTRRKLLAQIQDNDGFQQLRNTLDRAASTSAELNPEEAEAGKVLFMPFREIQSLAKHVERIATGISWLDKLSSGGGRPGEMWLVLGSTGGGKTQFTVQYSCEQALNGRATLWATYEQPPEGDIAERIIASVTKTDLMYIRDRGFDNLDENVRNAFWDTVRGVENNLGILNMTNVKINPEDKNDNGGIYTVWKELRRCKESGMNVRTVIIDWIGAMVTNIAGAMNKTLDSGTYRFIAGAELQIAKRMAEEEKVLVIFMQQTNTEAQNARPTFCPNSTSTKDMRDISHWMDLVLAIGRLDVNGICWFAAVKGRKGSTMKLTTRLIGGLVRFVEVEGYVPAADGNFYNPKDAFNRDAEDSRSAAAFAPEGIATLRSL